MKERWSDCIKSRAENVRVVAVLIHACGLREFYVTQGTTGLE